MLSFFSSTEFLTVVTALNTGFIKTLQLFFVTLVGAVPLGLVISFGSMSRFTPLRWLTRALIWVIRGTPLMLQLYIIFFIPGMVLPSGNPWPAGTTGRFMAASVAFIINYSCYFAGSGGEAGLFPAVAVAFVINYACYFSEIYRGGIQGVPVGQQEAGLVLGMTKRQIFFKITLLQMVKRIVPPMSNEIITLVKDTSLARVVALQEVIWMGESFMKGNQGYAGLVWPLFFTAVYYLVFSGVATILLGKLEKKLEYFR